jgi:sugar/nucleoside kinase (ribokinase family)
VPRVDLLVVGEAFEDLVFVGLPRLPRAGEELRSASYTSTIGGGAVITATAAARLGVRTAVISALSPAAVRHLRSERVRVRNVLRRGERHAVTAALSTRDDRSFVTFDGANDRLESRLLRLLPRERAAHVHFALAPRRIDQWIRIVSSLRLAGATSSWDFGWNPALARRRGFGPLVSMLDFVFMNRSESRLYARARQRGRNVVIKLGKGGSRWIGPSTDVFARAPRAKAVDTTGAGDAFNGGFLCAFLEGQSPRACLRLGNFVGARSTTRAGGLSGLPSRGSRRAARVSPPAEP